MEGTSSDPPKEESQQSVLNVATNRLQLNPIQPVPLTDSVRQSDAQSSGSATGMQYYIKTTATNTFNNFH